MRFFDLFTSRDKKPVLWSLLVQRDECSRMVGNFYENDLKKANQVIIISINGNKDDPDIRAAGCSSDVEIAGILMKSAHKVADHGI